MAFSPVRRVVTGTNLKGQSFILDDGPTPATVTMEARPGFVMANIWRTGSMPSPIDAMDDIVEHTGVTPPENGTIIRIIDIPPEPTDPKELQKMFEETFKSLFPDAEFSPEQAKHMGMHKHGTIDYAIVLEGQVTLVVDTEETVLNSGDVVVQRGTNHAWSNRSGSLSRVAFISVDAA